MRQGKVKWYNGKKCFGFISPDTPNEDGNTDDVFVHSSSLKAAGIRFLNENDIVEFEEEVRNGKLSATTIAVVQRDEESARRFQERRAERRRAIEERKNREEKLISHLYPFRSEPCIVCKLPALYHSFNLALNSRRGS